MINMHSSEFFFATLLAIVGDHSPGSQLPGPLLLGTLSPVGPPNPCSIPSGLPNLSFIFPPSHKRNTIYNHIAILHFVMCHFRVDLVDHISSSPLLTIACHMFRISMRRKSLLILCLGNSSTHSYSPPTLFDFDGGLIVLFPPCFSVRRCLRPNK